MIRRYYIVLLVFMPFWLVAQTQIAVMEFDGNDIIRFTIPATSGDCDNNPGVFGINNNSFEIRDVEGENCCPCIAGIGVSECGDNSKIALSDLINLSGFCNISVIATVRLSNAVWECNNPSLTSITNSCDPNTDPGRDAMKIEIVTISGGNQLLGGFCGDIQIGSFRIDNINDPTLFITITGGTEALDEAYFIDRIEVIGFPDLLIPASITANNNQPCDGQEPLVLNVIGSLPGSRYEWFLDGTPLNQPPQSNNYIQSPARMVHSGTYSVIITSPGGCTSQASIDISVQTCLPMTATFSNLRTEYCKDFDVLMLPPESDEGVTGTWNVRRDLRLADSAFFNQITFTPDGIFGINPQTYNLTMDTIPPMGVFPPGGLELCVFEGPGQFVNLVELLELIEPNIVNVNGFGRNFPAVNDLLNLDLSFINPGTYPFEFVSIPAGKCKQDVKFVTIIVNKIERGFDNNFTQCAMDDEPIDFSNMVTSASNPSGRFEDPGNSGLDLSQPGNVDVSTLSPGIYEYYYISGGNLPCSDLIDTAIFTLEILSGRSLNQFIFERTDLCEENGFSVTFGNDTYDEDNPMGTTLLVGQAANGCDSAIVVQLVFNEHRFSFVPYFGCTGDGFDTIVNGVRYFEGNPFGDQMLIASNGCDSIITVDLIYEPLETKTITHDGCSEDGFAAIVNGTIYNEQNPIGLDTVSSISGCDTIISINLQYKSKSFGQESYLGNSGDPYSVVVDGNLYNEANPIGTDTLTAANGCDSIVSINLIFRQGIVDSINTIHCAGDGFNFSIGNSLYNEANPSGIDSLKTADNRDSVVITRLTFLAPTINSFSLIKTSGGGFDTTLNNLNYNEANATGTDTIPFGASNGCDSIIIIELIYTDAFITRIDSTFCSGDLFSISIGTSVYNEASPMGMDTLLSKDGVDSIIITDLVFHEPSAFVFSDERCSGDGFEYLAGPEIFNESRPSGIVTLEGADEHGCDSIIQVLLLYSDNILINNQDTICPDGEVIVGSSVYNAGHLTGVDTLPGTVGCDTIITTSLVVEEFIIEYELLLSCPNDDNGAITIFNLTPTEELSVNFDQQNYTLSDSLEIINLSAGNYNLNITSDRGCVSSESITIDRIDISDPVITTSAFGLDSLQLDFSFDGIIAQSTWSANVGVVCSDCDVIFVDPRINNTYTLTILDENDCTYSTSFVINQNGTNTPSTFYMANSITNFGTPQNSRLYLQSPDPTIVSYDLTVFSRWGELMFDQKNLFPNDNSVGWDGSLQGTAIQSGVYIYKLVIRKTDGSTQINAGDILVIN